MKKEKKESFCTIYLVRHGKTEWNEKKIIQGQSESNISKIGIGQAKKVSEEFRDIKFSAIYSSDLSMAYKTAEIIKKDRNLAIKKSKLLRGRSYGNFEGKHIDVYKNAMKDKLKERETIPEKECSSFRLSPFIETDQEILTRVMNKLKKIASTHLKENALVVTHGGSIKNFLIEIGYINRKSFIEGSFKHGGYVKLLSDGKTFFIEKMDGIKE